jgi:butyryl-CoA dehydrogenase
MFDLTPEQEQIRDLARDFATNEVAPGAARRDAEGKFPAEVVKKLGELGFMGVYVPTEWGGAGMDPLSYILAMEEIAVACASTATIMSVSNSLYCDPVLRYGTDEQKKRFLEPFASGKQLGCFCLSEPGSGSDSAAMITQAKRVGDRWVLNGTKYWVTNGFEADGALIFAQTDKEKRHKGVTAFLVPRDTPGYKIGKLEHKLGINATSTAEIILEDVAIPDSQVLGPVGDGFKVALSTLDGGRIGIAAQAIGIGRASLEASLRYASVRTAFGKPISDLQAIQFMLADMASRVDAARLLTWRAASLKIAGKRYTKEASMAKLVASEAAMWVTTKGIQVHGGYGYTKEFPVERFFRDAKITEIYEGTSEIQRQVIATQLLRELGD